VTGRSQQKKSQREVVAQVLKDVVATWCDGSRVLERVQVLVEEVLCAERVEGEVLSKRQSLAKDGPMDQFNR